MKTRIYSLPLVILCIFFDNSILHAQAAHVSLYEYFAKLPAVPEFPQNSTLQSKGPEQFEEHSDLSALEDKIESSLKIAPHSGSILKQIKDESMMKESAILFQDEKPEVKQSHDELLAAGKELQKIRAEYQENFRRLEDSYSKRKSNDLIQATRDKVTGEEYLLSVYLTHIKPAFKAVDDLLARYNYGDNALSAQTKNVFRGAQKSQALILSDIIERLKLERITISNCARLAQQGK
jgi:hypothetical protein